LIDDKQRLFDVGCYGSPAFHALVKDIKAVKGLIIEQSIGDEIWSQKVVFLVSGVLSNALETSAFYMT